MRTQDVRPPDTDAPPRDVEARRPSRMLGVAAGLAAAAIALGVAELVAGLHPSWRSPVLDVGDRLIDAVPPFVKDFAIDTFGTNDKLALLVGIGVVLGLSAAVMGVVALRHRLVVGVVGIGLFGVVGGWAAASRRTSTPWHAVLPSVIGAAAGIGAIVLLARSARRTRIPTTGPLGAGPGRRQFLTGTGALLGLLLVGAGALGAVGRRLGQRFTAAESRAAVRLPRAREALAALPATVAVDAPAMTPFVTPNADFYRIDTALVAPQVRTADYTLRVHGMVDHVIELSFDELLARDMVERDITMTCVSNEVGGRYVGNARWLGTRLDDLLREAGVRAGADQVVGRSADGYECGFPVAAAMDGRDALVVVGMNGEPLPIEHGFPVRLVVPGLYGYVSATKWLTEIEVTTFADFDHYWLRRGWAREAPIKLMSRIDTPRGLATVAPGTVAIAGVAWAQTIGIAVVEVRVDDGPWQPAQLGDVPSVDTWRQWVLPWEATPGRHTITVRATDANGAIQIEDRAEPIPDGASGLHQIVVIAG